MKRDQNLTAGNRRYDRMRKDLNKLLEHVPEATLPAFNRYPDYSYYYDYRELVKMVKGDNSTYENGRAKLYSKSHLVCIV